MHTISVIKPFLIIALVAVFTLACEEPTSPVSDLGNFEYMAFDTTGTRIDHGGLYLSGKDSVISGSWQFEGGFSGTIVGKRIGNWIELDLNPNYIDNNLLLVGTLNGELFSGEWYRVGIGGVHDQGTFSARKLSIAA